MRSKVNNTLRLVMLVASCFLCFHIKSAMADDVSACGQPPVSTDEEFKAIVDGQADILFKKLGSGALKAQIETSKRDIFLKVPNGDKNFQNREVFVAVCTVIMHSNLSDSDKIEKLRSFQVDLSSTGNPTAGAVLGGWLHYAIGPCRRQGVGIVHCDGVLESSAKDDRVLGTFVEQVSGIRSTAYDKFGLITAIDDLAKTYKGKHIKIGSKENNETGQFGFTLYPNLKTPIGIDFSGVDSTATSFYRLTIPFAEGARADGSKLDMIISNISLE